MFDILTYISVVSYFIVRTDLIKTFNTLLDINMIGYNVHCTIYNVQGVQKKRIP